MNLRRSTAYPCSMWGCGELAEWVEKREVKPNGLPASLGFYGWCGAHVPPATVPHPEPPNAVESLPGASESVEIAPLREIPLGMVEIATLLGVKRGTVEQWRHRGIFPDPDLMVSSTPLWWRQTVVEFAQRTGRGV